MINQNLAVYRISVSVCLCVCVSTCVVLCVSCFFCLFVFWLLVFKYRKGGLELGLGRILGEKSIIRIYCMKKIILIKTNKRIWCLKTLFYFILMTFLRMWTQFSYPCILNVLQCIMTKLKCPNISIKRYVNPVFPESIGHDYRDF